MTSIRSSARDALLDAAARLTYERGIASSGVDAIAAAAGVTKRTLYQHFAGKDALVAESLAARDDAAIEALRAAAQRRAARSGEPAILALFDHLERVIAGPAPAGCAFLNAALELRQPDHPARRAALAHLRARQCLVADLLAEAGIHDDELTEQVALLVDGAFAVGGSRRDPTAARRAKRATRTILAHTAQVPRRHD